MLKPQALELKCPVCGLPVKVPNDVMDGELIEHDCGATLEVKVNGDAITLEELNESMEDWGE